MNLHTMQVKETGIVSYHRQVGQGSHRPMEAQCCKLWGHPIRDDPQKVTSLWTNEIVPA